MNHHTKCVKNVRDGYHALPSSAKDESLIYHAILVEGDVNYVYAYSHHHDKIK
jgi:hypothetical protein